jgi:adenylosuccinate synthase
VFYFWEVRMPFIIVIGTQWGDEGKGRIVDLLSAKADIVARSGGGDNAGHTVTVASRIFKLHQIPSGVIHPHTISVLGSGMVINPSTLLSEIKMLETAGIEVSPHRLAISHAAHLITPMHRLLDQAQDEARGQNFIGTTGRGIGPAYVDKASRRGLRVQDILNQDTLENKMYAHVREANQLLQNLYHKESVDVDLIVTEYIENALKIVGYIRDTGAMVRHALAEGKSVLAEGAQGTLLDLDHGTYPYVTSSCTTAVGAFSGLGVGLQPVERIVGITKAFLTRVGSGPFPSEVVGDDAERLRGSGSNPWDEFGTTTGRPRRVGWLDSVLLRYAIAINGMTELAMTKLDILSGLPTLKICLAYHINGKDVTELPASLEKSDMETYKPVYEELSGWQEDISGVIHRKNLPDAARAYIGRIEEISGVPVRLISVGPEREQIIGSA